MRYFVVNPDGQRFGPADLGLLNEWAAQGRIGPATMLEEEISRASVPASQLPGLVLPGAGSAPNPTSPYAQSPYAQNPYANYPRPGYGTNPYGAPADIGQSDLTVSWVMSALGLFVIPIIFPIVGIVMANRAKAKGNPGAQTALIFGWVVLALGCLGGCCLFVPFFAPFMGG